MQIHVNFGTVQSSPAIHERVEQTVSDALRLHADRITRVEVHLHDDNGPKSGMDKRCLIEARLAGLDPLAVEARSPDLYQAIDQAAGKLERAIAHRLDKQETKAMRQHPRA